MRNRFLILTAVALTTSLLLFGCGRSNSSVTGPQVPGDGPSETQLGAVKTTVNLAKIGKLQKSSAIDLQRLILTATASSGEIVKDTSTLSGNAEQTVQRVLLLKPLRTWTIAAESRDQRDSLIHSGSTAAVYVDPGDTISLSLSLASRFAMYEAVFQALPDSISATASGTGKAPVTIDRLVLKVNGTALVDSVATGGFNAGSSVSLFFDYVTPGSHTVVLEAHGTLNGYNGLLYSGTSTFSVASGVDNTQGITLNWSGPTTSDSYITVILGKVGKVTVNGTLPGTVL